MEVARVTSVGACSDINDKGSPAQAERGAGFACTASEVPLRDGTLPYYFCSGPTKLQVLPKGGKASPLSLPFCINHATGLERRTAESNRAAVPEKRSAWLGPQVRGGQSRCRRRPAHRPGGRRGHGCSDSAWHTKGPCPLHQRCGGQKEERGSSSSRQKGPQRRRGAAAHRQGRSGAATNAWHHPATGSGDEAVESAQAVAKAGEGSGRWPTTRSDRCGGSVTGRGGSRFDERHSTTTGRAAPASRRRTAALDPRGHAVRSPGRDDRPAQWREPIRAPSGIAARLPGRDVPWTRRRDPIYAPSGGAA